MRIEIVTMEEDDIEEGDTEQDVGLDMSDLDWDA